MTKTNMQHLTRAEAERVLVQNGLSPTSPDEVIRSGLFKANFRPDDIETVIIVLRENIYTHETHIDAAHNLFRAGEHLSPQEINALLGIEVDLSLDDVGPRQRRAKGQMAFDQIAEIAIVAMFFSAMVLFGGMWFFKVGMFHQTVV